MRFFNFFHRGADARAAYTAIMRQARQPCLFGERGAPDSFNGRFDILVLHVHFVLRRLRAEGTARTPFGQALFDMFFKDMDQTMRELGVGDLSVGKKIRKMAQAFYGRAAAYDNALATANPYALRDVLARNLFPENQKPPPEKLDFLKNYVLKLEGYLAARTVADIEAGKIFLEDFWEDCV